MSLNTKQDQCALSVNHQLAFKITKLWLTEALQMFFGVQHVKIWTRSRLQLQECEEALQDVLEWIREKNSYFYVFYDLFKKL